jgi:hypothetical protein
MDSSEGHHAGMPRAHDQWTGWPPKFGENARDLFEASRNDVTIVVDTGNHFLLSGRHQVQEARFMLFIALILSALFLLTVNWFAWRSRHAAKTIVCSSVAVLVGPFFLMCILPPLALQALLLCGATLLWRATHRGYTFFLALSCGATLVAYGLSGIMVLQSERAYARLRARYPYESMEGRVPLPQAVLGGTALLPATTRRLSRLEEIIPEHPNGYREYQLEKLQEQAVELFINSPGFGISRMFNPTESGLAANLRREPVPLQPGSRFPEMWPPGQLEPLPAGDDAPLSL